MELVESGETAKYLFDLSTRLMVIPLNVWDGDQADCDKLNAIAEKISERLFV